jgi:hypothetical protein
VAPPAASGHQTAATDHNGGQPAPHRIRLTTIDARCVTLDTPGLEDVAWVTPLPIWSKTTKIFPQNSPTGPHLVPKPPQWTDKQDQKREQKGPPTWAFTQNQRTLSAVDLLRRYSNRSDLLEQLHKVSVILSQASVTAPAGTSETDRTEEATQARSRWLRHRFTAEDQQAMIDLYRSGAPARVVAEHYGIGVRAIKRLLQKHGVRRRPVA